MFRKKLLRTILCGVLACSLAACGKAENTVSENTITFSDSEFSDTSFTGSVTSVDGQTVTLSVAVMDGSAVDIGSIGAGGQGGEAPDMPDGEEGGEAPDMPDGEEGGEAPDMPDGEEGGEAPNMPDGEEAGEAPDMPDGESGEAPDMPDGESGEVPDMPDGEEAGEAPEKPDGEETGEAGGEVPEKPDGEETGEAGGEVPDKPDGEEAGEMGGEAPDMPDGENTDGQGNMEMETVTVYLTIADESILLDSNGESASLADIEEGTYLAVELDSDMNILSITITEMQDGMSGGGMSGSGSSGVDSYDALQEFSEDIEVTADTYASTGTDENAVHIFGGATVSLNDVTITRDSDDSTGGDNSSFYGVGAALLVTDGTAYVNGGTITTDAAGGAGIFSYGSGVVYVSDAVIQTQQDTSGGIHVAGGGTLYAWDLDVETNGESSAAIRSDRGSGTMVVDGGTYVSNGTGSPAVYCTADITVHDAVLTATASEAVCIEGLNTLRLFDCDLTGAIQDNSQNDCNWNVIVYQSMSGDSEVGNGFFSMDGGSITANNGGMFYTTNTECTFYLSDVEINYAEQNDFFLRCTGNANARGWGQTGSNGSQCSFTADSQAMEGDIIYDSISTLDFYMKNGSTLKGAFVDDETYAGDGGDGYCNVYISADSTWTVTGDSVITALYNEGTIVDESGNAVSIIGTDGTVYVNGSSNYTITVESYAESADMSASTDGEDFADYEVEQ